MQTMSELLHYVGGFVDGEGHIGIKKESLRGQSVNHSYTERVSVGGVNKLSIELFQQLWPGYFHLHQPGKNSNAPFWNWEVTGKKARDFLKEIRPYIQLKGLDADIVLALGRDKEKNKKQRLTPENIKFRNNLYEVLKAHRRTLWLK